MSSFSADPQAIAKAGKAFAAQVEPIRRVAIDTEAVQVTGSNAGRDYAAQGTAYQKALLTLVSHLLTPMADKTDWVADTLATTSHRYAKRERHNQGTLRASGRDA